MKGVNEQKKYTVLRKCPIEIMQGCPAPNILPYKPLSQFIKGIDIGEVRDLRELHLFVRHLCATSSDMQPVYFQFFFSVLYT